MKTDGEKKICVGCNTVLDGTQSTDKEFKNEHTSCTV